MAWRPWRRKAEETAKPKPKDKAPPVEPPPKPYPRYVKYTLTDPKTSAEVTINVVEREHPLIGTKGGKEVKRTFVLPEMHGDYEKIFLSYKLGKTFAESCRAKKITEPKKIIKIFSGMNKDFGYDLDGKWIEFRGKFMIERGKIAKATTDPEARIKQERRTLERMFADMITKGKINVQKYLS